MEDNLKIYYLELFFDHVREKMNTFLISCAK